MPTCRETLTVTATDRASVRHQVIMKFLEEQPGTGKGDNCSKYTYEVETTQGGNKVILSRPAPLNKGVDFIVRVEGARFKPKGQTDVPSHTTMIIDLSKKKESNQVEYKKVKELILKIYQCEHVDDKEIENIHFSVGHPIDLILKSIKWLFIEQDVTYWNWSGRKMLFSSLQETDLC